MASIKPEPGDLIEIFHGCYSHWAIYVGGGYVVHLAPIGETAGAGSASIMCILSTKAIVKKEPLESVAGGNKYRVNNKLDDKFSPQPAKEIVQQAEEMVGQDMPFYLTTDNCEHFVNKLRYGVSRSDQVDNVALAVAVASNILRMVLTVSDIISSLLGRNKQKEQ